MMYRLFANVGPVWVWIGIPAAVRAVSHARSSSRYATVIIRMIASWTFDPTGHGKALDNGNVRSWNVIPGRSWNEDRMVGCMLPHE
jgi:hypothetical protein